MDTIDPAPGGAARRAARAPRDEVRISEEPALVLHAFPYKETSLIVEVFSRHHGRVALVARGAKRPRSALRGLLLAFRPLALSWSVPRARSGELFTLSKAEWVGGLALLAGDALLCGFYLNELLLKLLPRDDAHEQLFDAYLAALKALASGVQAAPVLRTFEYTLLREAGYALEWQRCVDSGDPVELDGYYRYIPERGPIRVAPEALASAAAPVISGKTLADIAAANYADQATLWQSKLLARQLLTHHLAGVPLYTRQMMIDLQAL